MMVRFVSVWTVLIISVFGAVLQDQRRIPILTYHRFGSEVHDSMTITTSALEKQLHWLKSNGYTVIPLDTAARYIRGEIPAVPDKAVVITVDDGHKSVYTDMAPLVKKYRIPVTLFVYPSAISNASYAMTWEELRELEAGGNFRVESHTYWHPNFKIEKKRLSTDEYYAFVDKQLSGSKRKLEAKLGHEIKYLAWVFGIYDPYLEDQAARTGYTMAFTIDRHHASTTGRAMAQPRYMVVDSHTLGDFERMVNGTEEKTGKHKKEVMAY